MTLALLEEALSALSLLVSLSSIPRMHLQQAANAIIFGSVTAACVHALHCCVQLLQAGCRGLIARSVLEVQANTPAPPGEHTLFISASERLLHSIVSAALAVVHSLTVPRRRFTAGEIAARCLFGGEESAYAAPPCILFSKELSGLCPEPCLGTLFSYLGLCRASCHRLAGHTKAQPGSLQIPGADFVLTSEMLERAWSMCVVVTISQCTAMLQMGDEASYPSRDELSSQCRAHTSSRYF